jgi:tRNA A-37 threonylcarbamoyl transferase component Bud32
MANPSPDPFVGQQVANFYIDELIKEGSLSRIYRGRDVIQRRPVAVKVIDASLRPDNAYAERFLREARGMMSGWWHPHITRIYYAARQNGRYIIIMEYVDGPNLKELLTTYTNEDELIPVDDVIRIGRAVAEALDYAHQNGVIHRDVKPSNVLVSVDGRVLLTDFGLVLPVEQELDLDSFGTANYMAPEQAVNLDDIDQMADLYSLAAMMYEMLVGQPPFPNSTDVASIQQRMSTKPPVPSSVNPYLSRQVDTVLLKALSRSPEKRYKTAVAFMEALTNSLGDPMEEAAEDGELPPLPAVTQMDKDAGPAISQISVVDRIASQLEVDGSEAVQRKKLTRRQRTMLGCWGILVAVSVLLVAAAYLYSQMMPGEGEVPGVVALVTTSTATPTDTAVPSPTPASTEPPMTVVVVITAVPPTTEATLLPTEAVPSATATAVPSPDSPTPIPTPPPTGPTVRFFYDPYSFYMFNPSDDLLRNVGAIAFQALDFDGRPTGHDFRGRDWSGIFANLESGRCNAIELLDSPGWLRPVECTAYNVIVTPPLSSINAFWVASKGISSFQVYWNGRDVGNCPVVAGVCGLRLP